MQEGFSLFRNKDGESGVEYEGYDAAFDLFCQSSPPPSHNHRIDASKFSQNEKGKKQHSELSRVNVLSEPTEYQTGEDRQNDAHQPNTFSLKSGAIFALE